MRKLKKKSYNFIAIDYSITKPGLCFTDKTKPEGFTCLSYSTPKKENYEHEILRFADYVDILINKIPYTITNPKTIIIIEDYAFGGRGKTNAIAECTGILKYSLFIEYKVNPKQLFFCSVPHLKMFVSGKGNAKKEMIIKDVYKHWNFDSEDNNQADAFVMWKILQALYCENETITKYQKDIIKRIKLYNKK